MLLVLMRHGIAEDGTPDEDRALTDQGRKRVRQVARLLGKFDVIPNIVLSSPRVRAIQTAEEVVETLNLDVEIKRTGALDFDAGWQQFANEVNARTERRPVETVVLATGHQPQMGMLATMAVRGADYGADMRKGSCAGIRFEGSLEAGEGTLDFYLTSKFARMAKKLKDD